MSISELPFPRFEGSKYTKEIKLTTDFYLSQWIVPKETKVKLFTTRDFGYCIIPTNTQDVRGFTIPRRIFKY